MKRHGPGHRPARPDELCACGAPGHFTWLDRNARGWAATCGQDLAECEPFPGEATS